MTQFTVELLLDTDDPQALANQLHTLIVIGSFADIANIDDISGLREEEVFVRPTPRTCTWARRGDGVHRVDCHGQLDDTKPTGFSHCPFCGDPIAFGKEEEP